MSRRVALGSLLIATCALFSLVPIACGSSGDDDLAAVAGDASSDSSTSLDSSVIVDAGAPRSFRLASGGVQLLVTGPAVGFQITPSNLATDVDIIEVHQEY